MSPQEVCGRGWLLPWEGERGGAASEMWGAGRCCERPEKRGKETGGVTAEREELGLCGVNG